MEGGREEGKQANRLRIPPLLPSNLDSMKEEEKEPHTLGFAFWGVKAPHDQPYIVVADSD